MNLPATLANTLWFAVNLPAWRSFHRALRQPEVTQQRLLTNLVARASNTAFGKTHHFASIRTLDEFRAQVPIRDYAELEPWIDRIRQGELNVLTPDPVKRLATTSGTTSARKLIPYTHALQAEFNRAIAPWIVDLFISHPSVLLGPAYWSISPVHRQDHETSAVPIGFEEDSEYLGGIARRLINAVMAVPSSVRHAPDMEQWRKQTLSHLSCQTDLRLISIWHPSFLDLLIADATLKPASLWPHLKVISCWADAHSSAASNQIRNRFPSVHIQPKGLIATEAIASIPFARQWPLAIRSHFFEFLASDGSLHTADELRQGERYEVIVTTSGGLYRYRLNDLVRVDGFVAQTPSIRFLGKISLVSDRFGEKLSQPFVSSVLQTLQAAYDIAWDFAMLAPEGNTYTLYMHGIAPPTLSADLDSALRDNPHYAYCRDLRQLEAPAIYHVGPNASAQYLQRLQSLGQRLGDIKPTSLSPLAEWKLHFGKEC